MSTVKSKKLQVGTDATSSNNFTIYQPSTPDGTLRIGVGNADSPTEVGRFDSNGYVATNLPAVHVGNATSYSFSGSTYTTVPFDTVIHDTESLWDATNYRWTPNVAGYYFVSTQVNINVTASSNYEYITRILRGGAEMLWTNNDWTGNSRLSSPCSGIIYCNGTTDYLSVQLYVGGATSQNVQANTNRSTFSAFLIKAT